MAARSRLSPGSHLRLLLKTLLLREGGPATAPPWTGETDLPGSGDRLAHTVDRRIDVLEKPHLQPTPQLLDDLSHVSVLHQVAPLAGVVFEVVELVGTVWIPENPWCSVLKPLSLRKTTRVLDRNPSASSLATIRSMVAPIASTAAK
jgi:hypothetical protein